ncbi:MAG: trypsin-like peptidase domain-containing protein [Myxococcota bacterium]
MLVWWVAFACTPSDDGPRRVDVAAFCEKEPLAGVCGGVGVPGLAVGSDRQGEHIVAHSRATLVEKRRVYEERVAAWGGLERAPDLVEDPTPDGLADTEGTLSLHTCGDPPADTVPDGLGGCKMVFGTDSRRIVDKDQTYPNNKFVTFTMGFGPGDDAPLNVCSGTFIDSDHVLTAAHCTYDTRDDTWQWASRGDINPGDVRTTLGVDEGMGYVCRAGWIDDAATFQDRCEFVDVRWVPDEYIAASDDRTLRAVKQDYAILRVRRDHHPRGLGAGAWMAISAIRAGNRYQKREAVVHAYPGVHPPGRSWNWDARSFTNQGEMWEVWGARQYRATGPIARATTRNVLRSKYDCSAGMSGAAVFYYINDATEYAGQAHYILGVHAADEVDNDGSTGDDHCVGPTARQFRDWAIGILP